MSAPPAERALRPVQLPRTADFAPTVVPAHDIFVMGDNRCNSYDSRYFGAISQHLVVGRAFLLIWPLSRFGAL